MSEGCTSFKLRRAQVMAMFGVLTSLVVIPFLLATSVEANAPEGTCLIKIDGVIYDTAPCNLNEEDGGIIRFGHLNLAKPAGYWAYLSKREDGRYDGFWNDDFGANHAHTPLGVLTLEDRAAGECFSNRSTLLCRNIPVDTHVYDVKFRSLEDGGNTVTAYLDGIEFEVQHPNWEVLRPYTVAQSEDLDGDGRSEAVIRLSHGGNCCPSDISIISYRGSGFFTYLDDSPITCGWGGVELVEEAGRPILRVHDSHAGFQNLETARGQRDSHNLSDEEEVFYDALAKNESAQQSMGEEVLVEMAREVAKKLRENLTVDWAVRDSVRAKLRIVIRTLLRKYKYPPDQSKDAVEMVLRQAERISEFDVAA